MIPKIIHYCWLSSDPIPEKLQQWMGSWEKYLPDYEFILWNFDRFDIERSIWVKQAFLAKKYAFAADYIRLYALYHYGGIYLDMDVEVLKSFDDLLDNEYLLAYENPYAIEAGIMGSQKGSYIFKLLLDYYNERLFIDVEGKFDLRTLPQIILDIISRNFIICNDYKNKKNDNNIYVYPSDYFTSRNYPYRDVIVTSNSYSIHHFAGSWKKRNLKDFVSMVLGKHITRLLIRTKHLRESSCDF